MKGITIGYYESPNRSSGTQSLINFQRSEVAGFKGLLLSHFCRQSGLQAQLDTTGWDWINSVVSATSLRCGIAYAPQSISEVFSLAASAAELCAKFPLFVWFAIADPNIVNQSHRDKNSLPLSEYGAILKDLWRGKDIDTTESANTSLKYLPPYVPDLIAVVLAERQAALAGKWADGIITLARPHEELKQIIDAFRSEGGKSKPVYLQVKLSYDKTYTGALAGARIQPAKSDWSSVFSHNDTDLRHVRISDSLQQHAEWIAADIEAGVSNLYLENFSTQQTQFIDVFGEKVLPQFHSRWMD